jgi:hypothetical protein
MPGARRAGIVVRVRQVGGVALGVLACAGGAWAPAASACPVTRDAPPTPGAVACAIDDVRVRHGLDRLERSWRLTEAGEGHAGDMVRRGYFSHTSPGGSSFVERIARTGYLRGERGWCVGEVLAYGTTLTARDVVRGWLDSPPHRRVLLTPGYRRVGIGVHSGLPTSGRDGVTVAAEFGARGAC